jgi:hypothetical protein
LEKTKDRILVLIVGGFVLGLIYLTVVAPQVASTFKYKNRLYHVIEESDVSPIMWLANNTPNGSVVVAAPSVSKAITPLSGRHVVAIERTMMRSSPERYGDASHFFQPNCDCACKDVRIERYGINYVYTRKSVDCPSLPLVHSENGVNIYKVADLINQEEIT